MASIHWPLRYGPSTFPLLHPAAVLNDLVFFGQSFSSHICFDETWNCYEFLISNLDLSYWTNCQNSLGEDPAIDLLKYFATVHKYDVLIKRATTALNIPEHRLHYFFENSNRFFKQKNQRKNISTWTEE